MASTECTRLRRSEERGMFMSDFGYDQSGHQEWSPPSYGDGGQNNQATTVANPFDQVPPSSLGGYGGGNNQGGYQPNHQGGYQQNKPAYQGNGGGYQKKPWTPSGGYTPNKNAGFQRKVWTPEELAQAQIYKSVVITGNETPPPMVEQALRRIVPELEKRGYVIRSGGMKGVENAVEEMARNVEVHLPWKGFDGKESKFTYTSDEAKEFAKRHHPMWDQAKPVIQTFCAKNVRLVLGKDLKSPTQILIIWSEDGAETTRERTAKTGLTGVALSVAAELRIPIFNLQRPDAEQRLMQYLG